MPGPKEIDDWDTSEPDDESELDEEDEELSEASAEDEEDEDGPDEDEEGAGVAPVQPPVLVDPYECLESELAREDDFGEDYWAFIEAEMGYSDVDLDTLPEEEVERHDRIRAMGLDELATLSLNELSDYCRWAAARAYLAHGDSDAFRETALPLISSQKRSPALDYIDITLSLVSQAAKQNEFKWAFELLERLADVAPEEETIKERFRGILTIQQGDLEAGLEMLTILAEGRPDDSLFLLSVGEDLCGIGRWEEALEYLEVSRDLARKENDQELLASIDNAIQYAQRNIGYDDVEE